MNALVLSGGGAKGDGQAGAAYYLHKQGIDFHSVDGVSVGALNGTLIAQGEWEKLKQIWQDIDNDDIYKRKLNIFSTVVSFIKRRLGVLDQKPLQRLLDKHYTGEFKIPFSAGYVGLFDGEMQYGNFKEAVLASATIPLVWNPIEDDLVDGGIRDNIPLSQAIKRNPDHIYIIRCSTTDLEWGYKNSLLGIAERTFEIIMNEIANRDISEFLRINEMVRAVEQQGATLYKKDGTPYKYFEYTIIEPEDSWGGMLDFKDRSWDKGVEAAKKALNDSRN